MTTLTALADLRARVRAAAGADRQIDADLARMVGLPVDQSDDAMWIIGTRIGLHERLPEYTASKDTAFAICEKFGWSVYQINCHTEKPFVMLQSKEVIRYIDTRDEPKTGRPFTSASHLTIPLAIVTALVDAAMVDQTSAYIREGT